MLCSIEIGSTNKGYPQSQIHYWVVAETLVAAIGIAKSQSLEDYPDYAEGWGILEAKIKSTDDSLFDKDHKASWEGITAFAGGG